MENIEWKRFRETEYFVSNSGLVMNTKKNKNNILNGSPDKDGYIRVDISFGARKTAKHFQIHRLVAECFLPIVSDKNLINHIDSNKKNNHYSNLEWCTCKENVDHFFNSENARIGEKCYQAKFTDTEVTQIKKSLRSGTSVEDLAAIHNVHRSTIHKIKMGKNWAHIS